MNDAPPATRRRLGDDASEGSEPGNAALMLGQLIAVLEAQGRHDEVARLRDRFPRPPEGPADPGS